MKNTFGFTVVEVVIVIAIIGILTGIAVVNLRNSLPESRDSERRADVTSLAKQLDNLYTSGYSANVVPKGSYPSTAHLNTTTTINDMFSDIDPKLLTSPTSTAGTISLTMATNSVATTAGVAPSPTTETYVYQPLTAAGTLCDSIALECRRFTLFYRLEGGTVEMIPSRNQ